MQHTRNINGLYMLTKVTYKIKRKNVRQQKYPHTQVQVCKTHH